MKKHLQRILSLLCVLAMALGTVSALAEDPSVQYEARVITVVWDDGDNYDGIRPESIDMTLGDQTVTLNEKNEWGGEVSVPSGTAFNAWVFETPEKYTESSEFGSVTVIKFRHPVAPLISVSATVAWDDSDNAGKIRPESVQLMLLADGEPCGEPLTAKNPGWKVTWDNLHPQKPNSDKNIEIIRLNMANKYYGG